jgi:hypothetical protein
MTPWQLPKLDKLLADDSVPHTTRGGAPYKPLPVGSRYGKLTVVGVAPARREVVCGKPRNRAYCTVVCDCGNRKEVARDNLVNGLSRSCGCAKGRIKGYLSKKDEQRWATK